MRLFDWLLGRPARRGREDLGDPRVAEAVSEARRARRRKEEMSSAFRDISHGLRHEQQRIVAREPR